MTLHYRNSYNGRSQRTVLHPVLPALTYTMNPNPASSAKPLPPQSQIHQKQTRSRSPPQPQASTSAGNQDVLLRRKKADRACDYCRKRKARCA